MKALACASYDYMKLMVLDLQRQLDEMDGNTKFDYLIRSFKHFICVQIGRIMVESGLNNIYNKFY